MSFFAKFRWKLRTKNSEAHFHRKLRTLEKCSNVKKLRTAEPQHIFSGSYKKKCRCECHIFKMDTLANEYLCAEIGFFFLMVEFEVPGEKQ